jgi:hypothetical protein
MTAPLPDAATYLEHPSFLKVVSAAGETLARCDRIQNEELWLLSFYAAGRRVEKWVSRADAPRMVKTAAALARVN